MPNRGGAQQGKPWKRAYEFRNGLDAAIEEYGADLFKMLAAQALGQDPLFVEKREEAAMAARQLIVRYGFPQLKAIEVEVGGAGGGGPVKPVVVFGVTATKEDISDLLE